MVWKVSKFRLPASLVMCLAARLLNLKSGKSIIQQGAFEKDSTGDSVSKWVGVILEIHQNVWLYRLYHKVEI